MPLSTFFLGPEKGGNCAGVSPTGTRFAVRDDLRRGGGEGRAPEGSCAHDPGRVRLALFRQSRSTSRKGLVAGSPWLFSRNSLNFFSIEAPFSLSALTISVYRALTPAFS